MLLYVLFNHLPFLLVSSILFHSDSCHPIFESVPEMKLYLFFNLILGKEIIPQQQITGSLDQTFASGTGANNAVTCLAALADGRVVLGGHFSAHRRGQRRADAKRAKPRAHTPRARGALHEGRFRRFGHCRITLRDPAAMQPVPPSAHTTM